MGDDEFCDVLNDVIDILDGIDAPAQAIEALALISSATLSDHADRAGLDLDATLRMIEQVNRMALEKAKDCWKAREDSQSRTDGELLH